MAISQHSRVKAIFADAIEHPPGTRAEFVARAAADDSALRSAVMRLLRHHESLGEVSDAAVAIPDDSVASTSEKIGEVIGPYKLLELLGEGGFGSVYRAEQQDPVRREVALKVIKLGMDTRRVIARFGLERRSLGLMEHPNIARVLDAGATPGGRPYFVMELVRGVPVTQYCDAHQLGIRERLRIFVTVCGAVQHAHQKGIIHRDIKPSNVLVEQHEGNPLPKVIDFGIAKATDQQPEVPEPVTEAAQVVGTPQYMSPEQTEPNGLDVDTRADVYGLGVLLYELLTGTTPFDARRLRDAPHHEALRIIREDCPPRPSTRLGELGERRGELARHRGTTSIRLGRDLKGDLDWIVMKALEKDRSRRYDGAGTFAADIERYLTDRAVEARPPALAYRARKLVRRNRIAISVAAVALAAAAVGVVSISYGLMEARRGRDVALAAQQIATSEKEKAQQVAAFLVQMLTAAGPMTAQGRDTTLLREILDQTRERVGRELAEQPEVHAELLYIIGRTYRDLARYDDAESAIGKALTLRRAALGEDHPSTIDTLNAYANVLVDFGRLREARPMFREVIQRCRARFGADDIRVAQSLNDLSWVEERLGSMEEAVIAQLEALRIARIHFRGDQADLAAALNQMGRLLNSAGRGEEAIAYILEGLGMRRRLFGPDHSEVALSLETLAYAQQERGQLREAQDTFAEILRIRRRVFGAIHPDVASALNNLGAVLLADGQHVIAEARFREALEIGRQTLGESHPRYLSTLTNLGMCLLQSDRPAHAEPLLVAAAHGRWKVLGPDHADSIETVSRLVALYLAQGRPDEARRWRATTQPGASGALPPASGSTSNPSATP